MKEIKSVPIWSKGKLINAQILYAYLINDNLESRASFYYNLSSKNEDGSIGDMLSQDTLKMIGKDYENYQDNQYAYDWIAKTLNVTIIGDYIEPPVNKSVLDNITLTSLEHDN
jgi:hypothetical protein